MKIEKHNVKGAEDFLQLYTDPFWTFWELHAPLAFDIFQRFLFSFLFPFLLQRSFWLRKLRKNCCQHFPDRRQVGALSTTYNWLNWFTSPIHAVFHNGISSETYYVFTAGICP